MRRMLVVLIAVGLPQAFAFGQKLKNDRFTKNSKSK